MLEFDNSVIAIENKLKSIPCEEQLNRYLKKERNLFVLSLYYPQDIVNYNVIHYYEIAELLLTQSKREKSAYLAGLYKDYSEFITSLVNATQSWAQMDNFDFHSQYHSTNGENNYLIFREIRIHDLYHKIKYNQLKHLLFQLTRNYIPEKFKANLESFEWFSNGTGAASLWYFLSRGINEVRLELQIQDNILRLMIISRNCTLKEKEISENQAIRDIYELFNEKYIQEITEDTFYPKKRAFNKYGKDLIYRYKRINASDLNKIVEATSKFFSEAINKAEINRNELIGLIGVIN